MSWRLAGYRGRAGGVRGVREAIIPKVKGPINLQEKTIVLLGTGSRETMQGSRNDPNA
jgi:hypothetical protein